MITFLFSLKRSKLKRIKTLLSQVLIDTEISHEEFITISNEEDEYEKMKENIRTMKSSYELNKEEDKKIKTTELKTKK